MSQVDVRRKQGSDAESDVSSQDGAEHSAVKAARLVMLWNGSDTRDNYCDMDIERNGDDPQNVNPNACYDELFHNIYVDPWLEQANFEAEIAGGSTAVVQAEGVWPNRGL